jgi:TetR/AcrR family transcriptional repressor of mexJK operon
LEEVKNKGLVNVGDVNAAVRMFVGPLIIYILLGGLLVTDGPPQQPDTEDLKAIVDLYMKAIVSNESN